MRSSGPTTLVVISDEQGEIDSIFFELTERFVRRLSRFRCDSRGVEKIASEYNFGDVPFFAVVSDRLNDFFLLFKA